MIILLSHHDHKTCVSIYWLNPIIGIIKFPKKTPTSTVIFFSLAYKRTNENIFQDSRGDCLVFSFPKFFIGTGGKPEPVRKAADGASFVAVL